MPSRYLPREKGTHQTLYRNRSRTTIARTCILPYDYTPLYGRSVEKAFVDTLCLSAYTGANPSRSKTGLI